jgi:Spy/CpxP family protein refolding chaperone
VKDRPHRLVRTPLALAALGLALALPLAGCAGKTASDTGGNAAQGSSGASSGAAGGSMQGGAGPAAPGGSPMASRRRMGKILLSLGLSDDQKSQIRTIMRNARKDSMNADGPTRKANFQAALAKIDTVLSPDQRTKFDAEMRAGRGQSGGSAPAQSQS